jgi:4-diphosphocytidyl-2-C-methyl-D-erythritol kinase
LEKISLRAPAKINIYLFIVNKRGDGYHNIESLMQAVDLYDDITLEKSDSIELSCSDPSLPPDLENLAFKAAARLQSRYYFPGVKIELVKNIPSGAGLGGGSSDAAFILRGIIKLYGLRPTAQELTEIAASVGSDVPFFLTRGQALVEGRGEVVRPVNLPLNYEVIVVSPPISISTAEVYGGINLNLTRKDRFRLLSKRMNLSKLMRASREFRNDLENVVISKYPDLANIRRSLLGTGAFLSLMTGSGSSFFGLFAANARPTGRFDHLKERGYKIFCCKPVLLPPTLS